MSKRKIIQGEVYMCNLSIDTIDSEQCNVRPVLIASVNVRNNTSPNVFIFPMTHARKKEQPCHYLLSQEKYPFLTFKQQIVLCEEGRSVSKKRLERYMGRIDNEDLKNILSCKEYVFIEKST